MTSVHISIITAFAMQMRAQMFTGARGVGVTPRLAGSFQQAACGYAVPRGLTAMSEGQFRAEMSA